MSLGESVSSASKELMRSLSLPVVARRHHRVSPAANIELDVSPAGSVPASGSSTPTRGKISWKNRQAASIESCLWRQQKEKVKASQERDRRSRILQVAKRLSLSGCANPEVKAWALTHGEVKQSVAKTPAPLAMTSDPISQTPSYHRLCGFIPTENEGIGPLLSMLNLQPEDVFYDLGCGDGRIVISVVKHFRCHGVGIEVNRLLVNKARSQVKAEFANDTELLERAQFIEDDISHVSLSDAKVVYIYMPDSSVRTLLREVLPHCDLQDGTLICVKDTWIREEVALRNCKYTSSNWRGGIHCYKWQKAELQAPSCQSRQS